MVALLGTCSGPDLGVTPVSVAEISMMWIATGLPLRARTCRRSAIGGFAGSSFDRGDDGAIGRGEKLASGGNGLSAGHENGRRKIDYLS
jgi:hypothetical protein